MVIDIVEQSGSQAFEALVPMVDLFAVLAIVFMIYSSEEILESRQEIQTLVQEAEQKSEEKLKKALAEFELESEKRIQEAKARNFRISEVSASKLAEIKEERERKTQQLMGEISNLLALEQSQSLAGLQNIVSNIELKADENLEMQKLSLEKEKERELKQAQIQYEETLATTELQLEKEKRESLAKLKEEQKQKLAQASLAQAQQITAVVEDLTSDKHEALDKVQQYTRREIIQLENQKQRELTQAKLEREKEIAVQADKYAQEQSLALAEIERQKREALLEQQAALEDKNREALMKAETEYSKLIADTEAKLTAEKLEELARAEEARTAALTRQKLEIEKQKQLEANQLKQEFARTIAATESTLEAEKARALADAQKAGERELASQKAALDRERDAELRRVDEENVRKLASAEAALKAEKAQALAEVKREAERKLAAQKSALEKEKEIALADTERAYSDLLEQEKGLTAEIREELQPFVEAAEARKKIVEQLAENFKDIDDADVEIDKKTGRVKLNFQHSYFVRGSYRLSEEMKDFLRIMIPKYARSIYENQDAAKHVQSLKISGMTSPVYLGVYVDINDTSPATEKARKFNMALSNQRAIALYNFIFDKNQMSDYPYRNRLKADMGIAALGFQNATPVPAELVGKPAKCLNYDCQQEQATLLQFNVYSEE